MCSVVSGLVGVVCWGQGPQRRQATSRLPPCLLPGEFPSAASVPGLSSVSALILGRTTYLRLLPGFANCFPFSWEPKEKWDSQPELGKLARVPTRSQVSPCLALSSTLRG